MPGLERDIITAGDLSENILRAGIQIYLLLRVERTLITRKNAERQRLVNMYITLNLFSTESV